MEYTWGHTSDACHAREQHPWPCVMSPSSVGSDSLLCPHPMYRAPSYMLTPRVTLREGKQFRAEGEMALTQSCSGDEDPLSVVCFCRSPILQNETDVHSNEVPFFRSESHC